MKITAVKKDSNGTISEYKLEDGAILSHEKAVKMAENNKLAGYNVATARNGMKSIRSNPDGDISNNLDELPEF